MGDVDILINNAGLLPRVSLLQGNPEDLMRIIKVNLVSHFWVNLIEISLLFFCYYWDFFEFIGFFISSVLWFLFFKFLRFSSVFKIQWIFQLLFIDIREFPLFSIKILFIDLTSIFTRYDS